MSRWEAGTFWSLTTVVLLSPLPVGSDRPLPASLLFAAIGALVLVWAIGILVGAVGQAGPVRPLLPAAALFACTVAWAAAQASSFTPAPLHHPYWAAAGAVLARPAAGAISVDPEATWTRLQGLLAYGGVFWLAFELCGRKGRARQVLLALALAGLLYAAWGVYAQFTRPGPVTSTFVNRNSYATYAGITLFCGLSLVVQRFARYARDDVPIGRALVHMFSRLDLITTMAMLSCLACGMALLLTGSRGAVVAVGLALLLYLWLLGSGSILRSRAFQLGLVVVLVTAAGLLRYSGEQTIERFGQAGANFGDRIVYYETTWRAMQDRPLLGTGYGTYADAFRAYNGPETETYFLDKAHNTYLQLMFELGWPAALALFAGIGHLASRCWQGARSPGRDRVYPATALACSVLVGVHSLVDFSIEMPANAITYALLLGMGCARAGGRRRSAAQPAPRGALTSPG
jgi:O-antigen ligase